MVDIIDSAEPIHQIEEIIDIGDNIFSGNRTMFIREIAIVADNLIYGTILFFNKGFDEAAAIASRGIFRNFAVENATFTDFFNFL